MIPAMNNKILSAVTFVCVLVGAMGCQAGPPMQSPVRQAVATAGTESAGPIYFFTAAQLKLKEGDVNSAIRLLERAVELDPASAYLKLELVNLLLIRKEDQRALILLPDEQQVNQLEL